MTRAQVYSINQQQYQQRLATIEDEMPHPFRFNYKQLTKLSREELREVIRIDTKIFLARGGKIKKIPYGQKTSDWETY